MIYRVVEFIKARPAFVALMAVFILMVGPVVWLPMFQITLGHKLDAMNRAAPATANGRSVQFDLLMVVAWYVLPVCWSAAFALFAFDLRKVLKKEWPLIRR